MAVIRCKMCGADLPAEDVNSICKCEYCGSNQTIPSVDSEKAINLFDRANRFRLANEFDKAYNLYEDIVSEFPNEAEAYWGLVLCKYGIEYVDDPSTGEKIPTCHRLSYKSVLQDDDYKSAIRLSDVVRKKQYEKEAELLESIRSNTVSISSKENPYDIFICYKENDDFGERTLDSVLAQDIYDALTENGYRVFFARVTLESKLGEEYEPYIFSALNTAKIMLVVGTQKAYFESTWVKNEWSRFIKMMNEGQKKILIPCYKDIDPYEMPDDFKRLQSQDMGKIGSIQDLVRGIKKLVPLANPKSDSHSSLSNQEDGSDLNLNYNFGMKLLEKDSLSRDELDTLEDLFSKLMKDYPWSYKGYYGYFLLIDRFSIKNDISVPDIISYIKNSQDLDNQVLIEVESYLQNKFSIGMECVNANKIEDSKRIFNKLIKMFPDSCMGYYGLICAEPVTDQYNSLYSNVKQSDDVTPEILDDCNVRLYESMNKLYQNGVDLIKANQSNDAKNIFSELIRLFPQSYLGYYGMICAEPVSNEYHKLFSGLQKAVDHKDEDLEECRKRFAEGIDCLFQKGLQEVENQHVTDAYYLFKKIEKADNNNWKCYYGYMKIAQTGKHSAALESVVYNLDKIINSEDAPSLQKEEAARFLKAFKSATKEELEKQLIKLQGEEKELQGIIGNTITEKKGDTITTTNDNAATKNRSDRKSINTKLDRKKIKAIIIGGSAIIDIVALILLLKWSWSDIYSFGSVLIAIVKTAGSLLILFVLFIVEMFFGSDYLGKVDEYNKKAQSNIQSKHASLNEKKGTIIGQLIVPSDKKAQPDMKWKVDRHIKMREKMIDLQNILSDENASMDAIYSIYTYLKENNGSFNFSEKAMQDINREY